MYRLNIPVRYEKELIEASEQLTLGIAEDIYCFYVPPQTDIILHNDQKFRVVTDAPDPDAQVQIRLDHRQISINTMARDQNHPCSGQKLHKMKIQMELRFDPDPGSIIHTRSGRILDVSVNCR
jgi:hypothetical protein